MALMTNYSTDIKCSGCPERYPSGCYKLENEDDVIKWTNPGGQGRNLIESAVRRVAAFMEDITIDKVMRVSKFSDHDGLEKKYKDINAVGILKEFFRGERGCLNIVPYIDINNKVSGYHGSCDDCKNPIRAAIFINTGYQLTKSKNIDILAVVIVHEVSHIVLGTDDDGDVNDAERLARNFCKAGGLRLL